MLGCQPISDREQPPSGCPRKASRETAVARDRADRVSPAMEVKHDSARVRFGRSNPLRRDPAGDDRFERYVSGWYEGGSELLPAGTDFLDRWIAGDLARAQHRNQLVEFRRCHGI